MKQKPRLVLDAFLHGGDYNPEQWKGTPDIWDEDIRLLKLARCNSVSLGIFAWASLEPAEGEFEFDWLDTVIEKLANAGIKIVLATPSAARPAWLSERYPEVLRVGSDRVRILHGHRHNHCPSSPIYRDKVALVNRMLAERYGGNSAVVLWHVSNEYGGECHCDLCQQRFRDWLKSRYGSLEKLNEAWWNAFWSHSYSAWSQIQSPAPHGENRVHGLNLDWKRFVTDLTVDFFLHEIRPLRELAPHIPVTTNFMGTYTGLNYQKFAQEVDIVSWDSYPVWHSETADWRLASDVGFVHDLNRSLKHGQPFLLMESTPSMTNWQFRAKLKRPGMHVLSSIQAIAHGSDSVQYFQWRKSRGGTEKFHGAVVDHAGHENTRVFREVAQVGDMLQRIVPVLGTRKDSQVALIYDWENRWAVDDAMALGAGDKGYLSDCLEHYREFWKRGIQLDIVSMEADFTSYSLVLAPMLYMVKSGIGEKIAGFIRKGGIFITTYFSGMVDERDLCYLGGFPGPLRKTLGIWVEETDALYPGESNSVVFEKGNFLGLSGEFQAKDICEVIHPEGAEILAVYGKDFYQGKPAVTTHRVGSGRSYYLASRNDAKFLDAFYTALIRQAGLKRSMNADLPEGVSAQKRSGKDGEFLFLMNFQPRETRISLEKKLYWDLLAGKEGGEEVVLPAYGISILREV